ncbi:hypothetical protein BGL34_04690 [Fructilactobacillus lindneri]|nr:hypothetical protein [Fructilactobacillus lindneri]ANZ57563.1 hypothetical protein AYR60_01610 [Fructilactobacillus lindneri]ANZ58832.1 hypothetical protein AYR59_01610 [Fructilactobacillus lindneri]POG97675.1 hypothetical protein BGL31_06145 [Fructilactobacillus lindneri]POH00062.1 hypothetical protein BGL32_04710 [Fructilactobacillus lindneri]POH02489.1 hypothetical protein BGL33_04480 [Fructilactobacillus lindneri]
MADSLNAANVKPGSEAVVTGFVQFNSLAEKVVSRIGMDHTPAYTITLSDPKVVSGDETLVKYLENHFYHSAIHDDTRATYISKAPYAPTIYGANSDAPVTGLPANEVLQVDGKPAALAVNQQVYVLVRCFKPKNFNNLGLALEAVKIQNLAHPLLYTGFGAAEASDFGTKTNVFDNANVDFDGFPKQD